MIIRKFTPRRITLLIAGLAFGITIYMAATVSGKKAKKQLLPLTYVAVDTAMLNYSQHVYIAVNLKSQTENRAANSGLTSILKIRNTSFSDTIYVLKIDFYDKEGKILKKYIDSVLLVKPMATAEMIVKKDEFKERGDNFIVEWRAATVSASPLIQVITSDRENKVVSTTNGVLMEAAR